MRIRNHRLSLFCLVLLLIAITVAAGAAPLGTAAARPATADQLVHLPFLGKPHPTLWARAYGQESVYSNFSAVVPLAGGGMIWAGQAEWDTWLVRPGTDGTLTWEVRLPDLGPSKSPHYPVGLAPAASGAVVAGMAEYYDYGDEHWYQDVVLLEVNAWGSVAWQKRYVTNKVGDHVLLRATSGGYFVAADSTALTVAGDRDLWLLKVGTAGQIVWQYGYESDGWDRLTAMDATSDGGVVLAGLHGSSGAPWIVKIDNSGAILWQRALVAATGPPCTPTWIAQTADAGMIVAGVSDQYPQAGGCLIKLSAAGDVTWGRRYDTGLEETFYSVAQTPDGGYIASGQVRPDANEYQTDAWLVRLNSSGGVVWARRYGSAGYNNSDSAFYAQPTGDGYLVLGRTGSVDAFTMGALVLLVDDNGLIPVCDLVNPAAVTVTEMPLLAIPTSAQRVATAVSATIPDLLVQDGMTTMVPLCPGGGAAGDAVDGCRP